MGKTGKESLKRRVNECEPHNLIMDTIQRVKRATDGLDVVGVAEISATAATFALWVRPSGFAVKINPKLLCTKNIVCLWVHKREGRGREDMHTLKY